MSGIEVAGIVLGSIPLVISALEHYADGVAIMKNMKEYEQVFDETLASFRVSVAIFVDSCYELLGPLNLPDQQMNSLLEKRSTDAWKDSQLQSDIEKRMGSNYHVYLQLLDKLYRRILLFCSKLKLNDNLQPSWIGPDGKIDEKARKKFFKGTWTRIRGGFDSTKYASLLESIDNDITKMSRLTAKAIELEPLRAERKSESMSVYWENVRDQAQRLFESLSSRFYSCSCHHSHQAKLRLDGRRGYDPKNGSVCFSFLLTFEKSACGTKKYPWDWRDIEIETTLDSNTLSTPHQQPSIVISSTSSTSIPLCPSPSLALKIDDLCNALIQGCHSKQCLGFLDSQAWQHFVYYVQGPGATNEISDVAPLKDVIQGNSCSMTTLEKCTLAFNLASAVLQLCNTPWLPTTWSSKDIFMLRTMTGSTLPSHFYVSQTFGSSDSKAAIAKRRRCVKNEMVFALGVALLELSYGQPLASQQLPEDLNERGEADSMTGVSIATRLADRIHEREMENYAKAVLRCIRCNFDTFSCDFKDRKFSVNFYNGVVAPLKADYEYATGGRP